LVKNKIAVDTPAYGRKTPEGSFTTASSFCSSTRALRSALCAVRRTEQHAVGHDNRRAAAGLEQLQEQRQEQQLGLLRLHDPLEVLGVAS
jgi:hypothetical protein